MIHEINITFIILDQLTTLNIREEYELILYTYSSW